MLHVSRCKNIFERGEGRGDSRGNPQVYYLGVVRIIITIYTVCCLLKLLSRTRNTN